MPGGAIWWIFIAPAAATAFAASTSSRSSFRHPLLEVVETALRTTATSDFGGHSEAFKAAAAWSGKRLRASWNDEQGEHPRAPHLCCADYEDGRKAYSLLQDLLSPEGVTLAAHSEEDGACYFATASHREAAVIAKNHERFKLRSCAPFPSALKIAPGLLEHDHRNNLGRLNTRHGAMMRKDNVEGLSVELTPGALPADSWKAGVYMEELVGDLLSESIDLRATSFWSDPAMAEGEHLATPQGAVRGKEWNKAAAVVHGLSEAASTSPGDICSWNNVRVLHAGDDLLLVSGLDHLLYSGRGAGGTWKGGEAAELRVACFMGLLSFLAGRLDVLRVSSTHTYLPLNAEARANVQSATITDTPLTDAGLDGTGQVIQIIDTGLDESSCFFVHDDTGDHITHGYYFDELGANFISTSSFGDDWSFFGDDDWWNFGDDDWWNFGDDDSPFAGNDDSPFAGNDDLAFSGDDDSSSAGNQPTPAPPTPSPPIPAPPTPAPTTPARLTPPTPAPTTPARLTPPTPAPTAPARLTPPTPAPTTPARLTPPTPAPTTPSRLTPPTPAPTTPARLTPPTPAPTTPARPTPPTPAPTTRARPTPPTPAPTTAAQPTPAPSAPTPPTPAPPTDDLVFAGDDDWSIFDDDWSFGDDDIFDDDWSIGDDDIFDDDWSFGDDDIFDDDWSFGDDDIFDDDIFGDNDLAFSGGDDDDRSPSGVGPDSVNPAFLSGYTSDSQSSGIFTGGDFSAFPNRRKVIQYINLVKSDDIAEPNDEYFTSDGGNQFPWLPADEFEYDYKAGHGTHTAGSAAGATLNNPAELITCPPGTVVSCVGGCIDETGQNDDLVEPYRELVDLDRLCPAFGCDMENPACLSDDVSETLTNNGGVAQGAKLAIFDVFYGNYGLVEHIGNGLWEPCVEAGCKLHSNSWGADEGCETTPMDLLYDAFMYENPENLLIFSAGNSGQRPFCTIGSPATAKNTLAVGATMSGNTRYDLEDVLYRREGEADIDTVTYFSSSGPTLDGRIKPEVVAPGDMIYSAASDGEEDTHSCRLWAYAGTSMSCPIVAGASAMVRQYFMESEFYAADLATRGFCDDWDGCEALTPSSATVKAILINSASLMGESSEPDGSRGFGRVHLEAGMPLAGDGSLALFVADAANTAIPELTRVEYNFDVDADAGLDFRATLSWIDPPSTSFTSKQLVHDLDLAVMSPSGVNYTMWSSGETDTVNVNERVIVDAAGLETGVWSVWVSANRLAISDEQSYSLVVNGAISPATEIGAVERSYSTSSAGVTNGDDASTADDDGGGDVGGDAAGDGAGTTTVDDDAPVADDDSGGAVGDDAVAVVGGTGEGSSGVVANSSLSVMLTVFVGLAFVMAAPLLAISL